VNEHGFVKSVHRSLPSELYKWKIHDTYTGGVPDAFYAGPSGVLFVEYKYIPKLPVRDTTKLRTTLSPIQIEWLNKMHQFGSAKVAVVIGAEETAVILTAGEWSNPLTKQEYVKRCVPRKDVGDWIRNQVEQKNST
tara:strand:- start:433 stop:840 length:408 start_codon:yes stop_codon:yes gene_type:complete